MQMPSRNRNDFQCAGAGAKSVAGAFIFAFIGCLLAVRALGAVQTPDKSAASTAQAVVPPQMSEIGGATPSGVMDPFDYDPRGRRDPFAQPSVDKPVAPGGFHGPLLALQRFEVSSLRLTGVIWDVSRPRAMVQDPENRTHVLGLNAKLGPRNGYIAAIREGEVVVVETEDANGKLSSSSTVIKLSNGQSSGGSASGSPMGAPGGR